VREVPVLARPAAPFGRLLPPDQLAEFTNTMDLARQQLAGRTVWHVNSTEEGGGVAEMLQSVLGYAADSGIRIRWLVIEADAAFFDVTKRLHHLLHGSPGDHGSLGHAERHIYESALAAEADQLAGLVKPGDPVVLHDPQTLGLAPALVAAGARVVWSCHIGADEANEYSRAAWQFLDRYTASPDYQVFSRPQYAWENLDRSQIKIIPPCIDAFTAKNQPLSGASAAAILDAAAVVPARTLTAAPTFIGRDQTTGRVLTRADMIEDNPVPGTARIVTQISRWDPLKDPLGVLSGFCSHGPPDSDVHFMLAGPDPNSIADDPDSRQTLAELRAARDALDPQARRRTHIACLPMRDLDENAAIVNALQRRADIVVQKSLAEGFGLTVAEAMWKARPTVASRVGGIQDQIESGVSGMLVEPSDLAQFGAAITTLLAEPDTADAMGSAAQARVCREYLAPRYLHRSFRLILDLVRGRARAAEHSGGADRDPT
jgi:trehalose synthase